MSKMYLRIIFIFIFIAGAVGAHAAMAKTQIFDVTLVKPPSDNGKVSWHGYYEFEYWDKENANTTFDAHKITVWMGIKLNDMAYLSSEVEYEHTPKLGKEHAGGSGEINVDSAQLRITPTESTVVYMGVFYAPFGIEYLSYPGHKNKLVTRPKVMKSGGVIPGTWSDVGIGVNQSLGSFGHMDVFYVNGDAKNGGISRDSSSGGNESKSLGARLMLDGFVEGFNIGGSYVSGKWDEAGERDSVRYGAHIRIDSDIIFGVSYAPVLIAEYVTGKDQAASFIDGRDKEVYGYYAQASVSVHPKVEIVARYGQYDNDKEKNDNLKTETSAGVVWHMLDSVQLKGEYQWNTEEGAEKDNNAAAIQFVAYW